MLLAVGNDGQFARFSEVAGHPEWAQDPRFATNSQRVANRSTLIPLMSEVTAERTTAEWIALLEHRAVPCGPINTMDQAFADAQVQARGLVQKQAVAPAVTAQTAIETIATVASPLRLGDAPVQLRHAPPGLGEHTDDVLAGLGLDAAAIAALRDAGVV